MAQPNLPASLQLEQGNPNKKNVDELKKKAEVEKKLQIGSDKLKPPRWLDKEGKKIFRFIINQFEDVGILQNTDLYHLAVYCDTLSEYMRYSQILKEDDYVETIDIEETTFSDDGSNKTKITRVQKRVAHPLSSKLDRTAARMRQFASDLALSPTARTKIAAYIATGDTGGDDNDEGDNY